MMLRGVFLLINLLMASTAFAGAWVQPKGHGLNINTVRFQSAKSSSRYEFNPYIEHGVSDHLTVSGNVGSRIEDQTNSAAQTQGYGEISFRAPLTELLKSVFSVQGTVGTVMDRSSQGASITMPMSEIRLLQGQNFLSESLYSNTEIGLRTFYGNRGNEWRLEQTMGWKHQAGRILIGQINAIQNWNKEKSASEYDSLELQASYVVPFQTRWNLQIGYGSVVAGENVAYLPTYFMGLWYRW